MTPAQQLRRTAPARGRRLSKATSRTELLEQVDRLQERVHALEAENETARAFAAHAAHEIIAPLVMTEAYASIIGGRLEGDEHAATLHELEMLRRGAARTRRLAEALLFDAYAANRDAERAREPVDLGALARECVAMLAPDVTAGQASVDIGPLPVVRGEEELLGSVLMNLFVNALKYNPRTGGTIRVSAQRAGDQWRIDVESDGPTIPAEDRQVIFAPYHRRRAERRVKGAGLGLAIARRIVERLGGRIGVEPGAAGGNRFYFTVPAE